MDRFIVAFRVHDMQAVQDLKSNMDRFIDCGKRIHPRVYLI